MLVKEYSKLGYLGWFSLLACWTPQTEDSNHKAKTKCNLKSALDMRGHMPVETPPVGEASADVGSSGWTAGFGEGDCGKTQESIA